MLKLEIEQRKTEPIYSIERHSMGGTPMSRKITHVLNPGHHFNLQTASPNKTTRLVTTLKWNQAVSRFEPLVRSIPVFFNSDVKAKNLPELARTPLPK